MNYTKQNLNEEYSRIMELMGTPVISEQTTVKRGGLFGDKLKIRKKGDNDWRLVAKRGFQFDKDNLQADDDVFQYIKMETGIKDLTPDQLIFSTRKDGKNKDVYAFMIVPRNVTPEQKQEVIKKVETTVKTEEKPEDDTASKDSTKAYNIKGDNTYEYTVIDGIWHTRKKGDEDWISLETNKKANSLLDNKFPDARQGESTGESEEVEEKFEEISKNNPCMENPNELPFPTCEEVMASLGIEGPYDTSNCTSDFLMYNNQPGDFEKWQNFGDDATGGTKEQYLEDVFLAILQAKPLDCQYAWMKRVKLEDDQIIAYASKHDENELLLAMGKGKPADAIAGKEQQFPYAEYKSADGQLIEIPEDAMKNPSVLKKTYEDLQAVGDEQALEWFTQYLNDNNIPLP